jgi:hypothetical protein
MRLLAVPVRTFLLLNLETRFLLRGDGCDNPGITIAEIVFLQCLCSVIINVIWFKLEFEFESYL